MTVPEWMHAHGLGARGDRLLEICVRLAAHHHPEPFFLSSRMAGQMLGLDHSDAAKLLKAMVYAGLLILVKPGVRSKASLYRLADPPSW